MKGLRAEARSLFYNAEAMAELDLSDIPHPADKILVRFISQLLDVQKDLIEGVYLTGSILLGDFHPGKSDIDFIVLLRQIPDRATLSGYKNIHKRIQQKFRKPRLNGYYLTAEDIRMSEDKRGLPSFFEGKWYFNRPFELRMVTLFELANASLTIYGRPAVDLPTKIGLGEVHAQLYQNINTYWAGWVKEHSSISRAGLLLALFPRLTEWGILGVARQLYTLETGKIASKIDAGYYALERSPDSFKDIILTAIDARKDDRLTLRPSLRRSRKTVECMSYMIAEFNRIYDARF